MGLPPDLPARMQKLPRFRIMGMDAPVPWFVQWFEGGDVPCEPGTGTPDFRVMDSHKWIKAVKHGHCWVCGEQLGQHKAFLIGPMCAINRVTSEPACHRDCAIWSANACPFLTRPKMRRNERGLPDLRENAPGFAIKRNPGCSCVWITKSFTVFQAQEGNAGYLISLGDPVDVLWFAEGKVATREQVMESIDSGYPLLMDKAKEDGEAGIVALNRMHNDALKYLPA